MLSLGRFGEDLDPQLPKKGESAYRPRKGETTILA